MPRLIKLADTTYHLITSPHRGPIPDVGIQIEDEEAMYILFYIARNTKNGLPFLGRQASPANIYRVAWHRPYCPQENLTLEFNIRDRYFLINGVPADEQDLEDFTKGHIA